jgi:alkaline phosphatase
MKFSKTVRMLLFECTIILILFAVLVPAEAAQPAKYVFLFIGDGMGTSQRMATNAFLKSTGEERTLLMNTFPVYGVTTTNSANSFITDSAAAATALSTGTKTHDGYIGVDLEFNTMENLSEKAKKNGMKVGIVSSVSIDHATPACFYAHQKSRNMYHEIDMELANSDFDYFGGGSLKDPEGKKSKAPLGNAFEAAKENGFTVVSGREAFMALTKDAGKIFAYNDKLDRSKALPYSIDAEASDITLAEFTQKGIEFLDNEKGFFMMVEGGKIDWTCHANDAATAVKDVLAFDDAIKVAYDFYQAHPEETLIVVTGDHETGGLTLGFAGTKYASYFDVLAPQNISYDEFSETVLKNYKKENAGKAAFEDMIPLMKEYFGLEMEGEGDLVLKDYEVQELKEAFVQSMSGVRINADSPDYLLYGSYEPFTVKLTHILNQKAGLGWTTYSHTGAPVSTSAIGVGAEAFNGFYDNTDIPKKISVAAGF